MKDSELIQKVHSGNKEAVGIIIERYYADIYRFCLYMVQTEDDAYDIAQETFLKFMKYGTSYKHHNLKGYLLTIARNICFNYFRDKKEKVTAIECEDSAFERICLGGRGPRPASAGGLRFPPETAPAADRRQGDPRGPRHRPSRRLKHSATVRRRGPHG